jgi:hypothetical protein
MNTMSSQELAAVLRRAPVGRHNIGDGWTREQVLDLWERQVRRHRRKVNLSVWDRGRIISLTYRVCSVSYRRRVVRCALAACGLAAVCLLGFAALPSAAAVPHFGEECKLAPFDGEREM